MKSNHSIPEILAPCGSYDILVAAISAGADACYIGGSKFGARAYAENLGSDSVIKAIDYAHIHNTKLYLTLNTLLKQTELTELYDYLLPYYTNGLDAVIVQDLGVFFLVKEMFPDLAVHCSTQMNINSVHAARFMKQQGADRVVTAREMPLSEIKKIKDELDIEVETFVHGAMCYSYSGQCLMSSLAGGRSGNRGRCAQPCRKCYDSEYILSMKDMCSLEILPEIIEAGVDSLKIEGRMKNEYYVASAVDAYKSIALDCVNGTFNRDKAAAYKDRLAGIYNRGGFCD
ncbi:MAG: peptidase U32 family protein, partial [Wujia sp.]